ncbi:hypothetical protein WP3W19E03_22150 [Aeromonas veronii]|uniref:CobQ/CobB/MinD/ParA nucleotide binding domain-containing protein n=1 Tax=Aeromonas veronii TaxID=654 RepID=A0A6S5BVT4_AERVE|nr:ParA family protein [Aeromonas veronii]BBR39690.1 hypothetical protein WP3W19E03_22150 [Aeromonas veronii]
MNVIAFLSQKGGSGKTTLSVHTAVAAEATGERVCVIGSVAKIVKLEHAWRRLDGRNDDGFQVAPFPG